MTYLVYIAPIFILLVILFGMNLKAQAPLFISEQGKNAYYHAYDSLLEKYDVPVKDLWIETYLGKAHLIETGNKQGKPVLMLHGAGLSAAEWYANFNALGARYHLFALDMPGDAGKSELYHHPEKIENYQLSILQILDSLNIDKVILLGHSIGGFFSTGFALAHPERVEKLVLLSPAATHVPFRWYIKLLLKKGGKAGTGPSAAKILKMTTHKGFVIEPAFVSLMEAVRDYTNVNMLFPYVYSKEELASIKVSTVLIIGTKENVCGYKKSVRKAKKKMPGIEVHIIDNAGHIPNMEYPEQVNKLLLSIFDEDS